jgi:hypothetical protein
MVGPGGHHPIGSLGGGIPAFLHTLTPDTISAFSAGRRSIRPCVHVIVPFVHWLSLSIFGPL